MPSAARLTNVERFLSVFVAGDAASGFLALAGSEHLDWISQGALLAALVTRAAKVCGWLRLDWSTRTISVLTLAGFCVYPLDNWFLSHSTISANVHMAVILTGLKVVTAKTDRGLQGYS